MAKTTDRMTVNGVTFYLKDKDVREIANTLNGKVTDLESDLTKDKEIFSSGIADENGEVSRNLIWESGAINTSTGNEYESSNSVRSQFVQIDEGDTVQLLRLDDDNKEAGWYANAMFYDKEREYLGSIRPGSNQYQTSVMRIPSFAYPSAAYVRFTKLYMNGDPTSTHQSIWDCYVRKGHFIQFEEKLRKLQAEYDIVNLEFTNAGGIANGAPYDIAENSQRFRTVTGYPFPVGSKIVIPDDLNSIYQVWVNAYYDAGRFIGTYYDTDDPVNVDDITDSDFEGQTENYYIAVAGKTRGNIAITEEMLIDLNRIIKIAVPKKDRIEERLSGSVTGDINLIEGIPFRYNRVNYWYETDGNVIEQKSEDTRIWDVTNTDISVPLKAGTYHFYIRFIENNSTSATAVAYKLFRSDGTIIFDRGARYIENYNNERTFTLEEDDTVKIQWKSYAGNRFGLYLYAESYGTLKMLSEKLDGVMSVVADEKYAEIYTDPVQNLVKKYDATAEAGKIGYIWISDLHINSLYPDRNKALKRQLMACADIANRTNIQFIVIGGDIIDRETSHDTIYSIFNEVFSGVKESRRPVALLLGNHDDNPYTNDVPLTKDQDRALFIDMNTVDMIAPDNSKSYYYFDRMGYRFICLDAIDYPSGYAGDSWWGFSEDQVKWLADVLGETTQNAIILSHITLDDDHQSWGLGDNGGYTEDIRDLIEAYNGRESITLYEQTYDFSSATGKIMFVHAGHAHFDEQYTKDGMTIPLLVTTCAKNETTATGLELVSGNTYEAVEEGSHWNTYGWTCKFWPERILGTITEAAFDVVSVGESTVNVFRVGAGEDRTFTPE